MEIKIATTQSELESVYKLRYQVFVEEDNKFNKELYPDKMLFDEYDSHEETLNIIIKNGEENIATVRTTIANDKEHLSCDHYYEGYKQLRSKQLGQYSSVGMLAVSKKNCSVKVLYSLIKSLISVGNDHQVDYALFPVNYKMQKTLERLGAVMVDKITYNETVGNHIAPMMLEIKKAAQRFGIKGYYTLENSVSI